MKLNSLSARDVSVHSLSVQTFSACDISSSNIATGSVWTGAKSHALNTGTYCSSSSLLSLPCSSLRPPGRHSVLPRQGLASLVLYHDKFDPTCSYSCRRKPIHHVKLRYDSVPNDVKCCRSQASMLVTTNRQGLERKTRRISAPSSFQYVTQLIQHQQPVQDGLGLAFVLT